MANINIIQFEKNRTGDTTIEAIDKMNRAIEEYKNLGTLSNRTTFLNLYVQASANAGQFEHGLAALDESIAVKEHTRERRFEAEAYRLKGEFLIWQAEDILQQTEYPAQAENYFQAARQIADQQGAKMLELRATTTICTLWQRQGKGKHGAQILADILSQFTEGLGEIEISRAKKLLNALNSE